MAPSAQVVMQGGKRLAATPDRECDTPQTGQLAIVTGITAARTSQRTGHMLRHKTNGRYVEAAQERP